MQSWYPFLKHLHITTAVVTTAMIVLRMGLDVAEVRWRHTPLRWLPHLNDSLLLASAIGLVTGWMPFRDPWLTGKLLLLCGYIIAGKLALAADRNASLRIPAALAAFVMLAGIFVLALTKPA